MSALTGHLALRVHSLPGPGCGTRHLSGAWSQLSLELSRTIAKFHSVQRRIYEDSMQNGRLNMVSRQCRREIGMLTQRS